MAAATHRLKTLPGPFDAIASGRQRFEYRKDDRGFTVGDFLHLQEYIGSRYSGQEIKAIVTHILRGPELGVPEGYVVMSIEVVIYSPFPFGGCPLESVAKAEREPLEEGGDS